MELSDNHVKLGSSGEFENEDLFLYDKLLTTYGHLIPPNAHTQHHHSLEIEDLVQPKSEVARMYGDGADQVLTL